MGNSCQDRTRNLPGYSERWPFSESFLAMAAQLLSTCGMIWRSLGQLLRGCSARSGKPVGVHRVEKLCAPIIRLASSALILDVPEIYNVAIVCYRF